MIGLIQRVSTAKVVVEERITGQIGPGILVLLGVEQNDSPAHAARLFERILQYRIFSDAQGRMNHSLRDTGGELLIVPQFTLVADTSKGKRPSFSSAAPPALGKELFEQFCQLAQLEWGCVQAGVFGADMQVHLVNDGPVTFWLHS